MIDSAELNRKLVDRFEEVCNLLLPNGKLKGSHYVVGNLQGDAGDSLQITISGAAAGRFKDFKTGDGGATPLWLWSKVRGIHFKEAVKQASEWLGIKEDDYGVRHNRGRIFSKPGKDAIRLAEPNSKVMDYLTIERRLDPIVLAKAKVAETEDGETVVFPFIETDPETGKESCVHRKYIKVDRTNGKKEIRSTKDTRRCLFGKNLISDNESELIVSEGEIDALSWHSWSLPGVSIPNGVSDLEWIDLDWEWLARFEKIYVCMDMDEPGQHIAPEICKRLGLHRCFIVKLPKKDVNECLQGNLTRKDMEECLASAKALELEEIKRPDEYTSEVIDYYSVDWSKRGWETPWFPALPWRVRKGEFTILSGFSGSGKTIALNHLMLHLLNQGCKIMDASLEIKPGMTLYNMTRCATGKRHSQEEEIRACIDWISGSMFFLDIIGVASVDRLLAAMEYGRKRHGIDVFVIDSLFKCGLDPSDFGAQRTFADKLTSFCNNTNAHVILVAHSRKTQSGNEYSPPTKSDVAGSSDITNAAFNVLVWFRNKLKKQKLDEARMAIPPKQDEIDKWILEPDGKAILDKQRFGEGEEASVPLYFNYESLQFHTTRNTKFPYFQTK